MVTHGPQLDAPLSDALRYPAKLIDEYPWQRRSRRRDGRAHRPDDVACGVARAGGRRGCDRALELPGRGHAPQGRAGVGHRQHDGREAGAADAVQRDPSRTADRRADRHPSRGRERRDPVRQRRRRGTRPLAEGRPHLVHRLDRGRTAHHGEGRGDDEAALPRVGWEVRRHRARRRRPRRREPDRHGRLHARRARLRHADSDVVAAVPLRRRRRVPRGAVRHRHRRRSPAARHALRARHQPPRNAIASSATSAPGSSKAPPR